MELITLQYLEGVGIQENIDLYHSILEHNVSDHSIPELSVIKNSRKYT